MDDAPLEKVVNPLVEHRHCEGFIPKQSDEVILRS